jgi:peptidoglycan biosynthesis protein MviN/MurJ (putative lipid II flippase)
VRHFSFPPFVLTLLNRYSNAGMAGTYLSDELQKKISANWFLFCLRVTAGLIGSLLLWTGIYDLIDGYTVDNSLGKDVVLLVGGLLGLAVTGTFYGKTDCVLNPC